VSCCGPGGALLAAAAASFSRTERCEGTNNLIWNCQSIQTTLLQGSAGTITTLILFLSFTPVPSSHATRNRAVAAVLTGDHSLHAPLLSTGATPGRAPEAAEVAVSCASDTIPPRNRHASIAGRLLPSCLWSVCILALVLYTQDVCQRPRFNFQFLVTTYSNGSIDALATILNCLAGTSVLLAAAALLAVALCALSSDVAL
jgi:hypothetical protein